MRAESTGGDDGMVMKREELNSTDSAINKISGVAVGVAVVIALAVIALIIRRRKINR